MMMETTERKVVFWTCSADAERLSAHTIAEAIEQYIDDLYPSRDFPETVTVYGFAHMEVRHDAPFLAEIALELLLERLDEDYMDPDGDHTRPTPDMQDAAMELARTVLKGYTPWMCEQVTSETVRIADYIPADWYEN